MGEEVKFANVRVILEKVVDEKGRVSGLSEYAGMTVKVVVPEEEPPKKKGE